MNETNNSKMDITLADIDLIQPIYESIIKVPYDKFLLLSNNFTRQVTMKGPGYNYLIPGIHTGYLVSRGTFDVKVMNPESSTGRYEQNVGIGDDISLSLKIRFQIGQTEECMTRFLSQQETYKNTVKTISEKIMRMEIEQNKDAIKKLIEKDQYSDIRIPDINLIEYVNRINNNVNQHEVELALEAIKLRYEYGIELLNVSFVDIDASERIKNARVAEIEAAKKREIARKDAETQRKIELENAKNRVDVAEQNALAIKKELEAKITMFKQKGFTNAEIAAFLGISFLPEGSNVIYGVKDNVNVPIITGGSIREELDKNNNGKHK